MDKYLQQILHEVNTIIIPGLGALTVTKKDSMDLMFMPFLKHDDGNLSRIISEKEGISENDAKNLIAKYVREIFFKLEKGESYDMYLFGKFYKENNEIKFQNWKDYNSNISSDDNYAILNEEKPALFFENTNETKDSLDSILDNSEKSLKADDDLINENIIINQEDENISSELVKNEFEKDEQNDSFALNSKTETVFIPESSEKKLSVEELETKINNSINENNEFLIKVKKKKSNSFYLLIFLLIIFCSSSVFYYFYSEPIKQWFTKNGNSNDIKTEKDLLVSSEKELDSIEQQISQIYNNENSTSETIVNEIDTPKKVDNNIKSTLNEKSDSKITNDSYRNKFHLIVGGFLSEENATRFATKLNKENGKALMIGKFDEKYLVSYSYFTTKNEAVSEMKNLPISSWVFYY